MRQKSELRPYQQRIATSLYEADEKLCIVRPGYGKTVSALTAIVELLQEKIIRHAVIIAPKRVARKVWPDEIAGWAHTAGLRYQLLTGTPQQRLLQLLDAPYYDLTIIGIDLVQWLLDELATTPPDHPLFDLLVIDEISKLRDPSGVRAKDMAKDASRWKMIWGMSGTLRPNSALDLFMPTRIVTRSKLWGKSFYKWQREYFYPLDYMKFRWAPLPGAEEKLNAAIAPLTVTLADDEAPQMPGLTVIPDYVELPPEARQRYRDMERHLATEGVLAANAAVATGKLAQIANGFIYDRGTTDRIHDEKREWLQDVIEQAEGPTLLVYEYREDLQLMRNLLGIDLPYLGAGSAHLTQTIDAWNRRELPFMAMHPAAGGHGLNLQTGGCDEAWLAPPWSPELWEQTIARLHRSGQTKPVIVRVCLADDTVDQVKLNRVHFKMSEQQAFEDYLRQHHFQAPLSHSA